MFLFYFLQLKYPSSVSDLVNQGYYLLFPLCNILYLSSLAEGKTSDGAQGGFNPVAELEKLRQAQQSCCRLEIGELIRVRGTVKTSRQQREIMASVFCECVNVTHNAQHMCAHYLNYLHIHRVCLALCVCFQTK